MKQPDLKPCPFCGGEAYVADLRYGQYVTCHHTDECHIRPDSHPFSGAKIEEQIKAWNRRVADENDSVDPHGT